MLNSNFIRTALAVIIAALPVLVHFLGCTTNAAGVLDCSGSWIPAAYLPYVMSAMTILGLIIKASGGPAGATVGEKLAAPAVPVVAPENAKTGVVTQAQVAAPGRDK